jgi:hypothetical protein
LVYVRGTPAVRNPAGRVRMLDMLPEAGFDEGWLVEESGLVVLTGGQHNDYLIVVDLTTDELRECVPLNRDSTLGMWLSLLAPNESSLCCLYEAGVLAIGSDGRLLWHQRSLGLGLTLDSVDSETLWLAKGWLPDGHPDALVGVRIADGTITGSGE